MLIGSCTLSGCSKNFNSSSNYATASNPRGNSCGNIANLGSVAEFDGKLYYQNGEDNYKIYTTSDDGKPVKLNDVQSYFINVSKDYIVYANADDDYHIYRMKHDGSENTKLNDVQSYYVNLYGDMIYYSNWSDENKIYSMDINGKANGALSNDKAYYVTVDEDKIYYSNWSDGAKLYSMDTGGSNKLKLAETGCWYVVPNEDWVYYSQWKKVGSEEGDDSQTSKDDKFLCRVKKDGSVSEVLNELPCGDINVYKDRVYFTNWLENKIYSMNKDGGDIKKVSDSYGVYLNLAGDRLYFAEYDDKKNVTLNNIPIDGEEKTNG